jgi:SAM-dependent methyltransferase
MKCDQSWYASPDMWLRRSSTEPEGFDCEAAKRLSSLSERDHFWMRERIELITRLLENRIGLVRRRDATALELGCGTGLMLPYLERRFTGVVAVDAHARLLAKARRRSRTATLIEADVCHPPLPPHTSDLILALDVIEHVDPDLFLASARRLIKQEGRLLLSAPAFQCLWSKMDELAGHRCRYRIGLLEAELARNGWKLLGHTHYQCLLFPVVYLSRRFASRLPASIERQPPAWLDRALGHINRAEIHTLSRLPLSFGSSVIVWAMPQ